MIAARAARSFAVGILLALAGACESNPAVGNQSWSVVLEPSNLGTTAFFAGDRLVLWDVRTVQGIERDGSQAWKRSDVYRLEALHPMRDGSFIASGWTNPDGEENDRTWVIGLTENGDESWRVEHTGLIVEQQLVGLADGGYVLSGNAYQSGVLADGTPVSDGFVAAFDGDQVRWLKRVGEVSALRVGSDQTVAWLDEPGGREGQLRVVDASGADRWTVRVPYGARLGTDATGRWLVQGFGEVMAVATDGTIAWSVVQEEIRPPASLRTSPRTDAQGRVAVPTDTHVRCFDAQGVELWRTADLADLVYDVAPAPRGGWLVAGSLYASLGGGVRGHDRLYYIDSDGIVGEPERFRGEGSISGVLTSEQDVRIIGAVSSELTHGAGTVHGYGVFVLARELVD